MIYPAIEDLTKGGKYNRYTLVVATAKCARIVTDEYVQQREHAEKLIANKETDKSLASMIKKEYRDEKAVKNAINRIHAGEFKIIEPELDENGEVVRKEAPAKPAPAVTERSFLDTFDVRGMLPNDVIPDDDELLDDEEMDERDDDGIVPEDSDDTSDYLADFPSVEHTLSDSTYEQ